jgi:GntP family gluconate:H+ symporter
MKVWTVGGTLSGVTALVIVIILSFFSSSLPGLM